MLSARRLSITALAGVVFATLSAQPVFAQQTKGAKHFKVDGALIDALAAGGATQRVIITVKPGYRDAIRAAIKAHGDVIRSEHPSVEAIAATVHSSDVMELANSESIAYVSIDATVYAGAAGGHPRLTPTTLRNALVSSSSQASTGVGAVSTLRETLGLPAKPTSHGVAGEGVGVAIIDSGIAPSEDIHRITAFYDFTRGGIPTAPFDDFGHGTHIAGLIGSGGALSNGAFIGVAPQVNFVGLKVLDKNGEGSTSDVMKALEYVTANHARLGVQIVNLSLGHPIYAPAGQDPLVAAVEKAVDAGLIVVCSAGNFGTSQGTGQTGYTGITSPGNSPKAITVGATDSQNTVTRGDDVVAKYSSRGPTWFDGFAKPDVVAPGSRLVSDAFATQTLFNLLTSNQVHAPNGRTFLQLSGTSMAAGVTSGVVALLIDSHNRAGFPKARPLTANLVKAMLQYSAIPLKNADALTQGTGEINAGGAMALASAIDTGAQADSWWLRSGVPGLTVIGGVTYQWSRDFVWGEKVLGGDALFYDLPAWTSAALDSSDNLVWGSHAQTVDDNIVWGTTAVWASQIVWSDRLIGQQADDNIVWGTASNDNIVWGTLDDDNIVWGTMVGSNIVFGSMINDNVVWGTLDGNDNIVWGTADGLDNIVWGTAADDNVVWGTAAMNMLGGSF